jgi:acyl-CoA thioesterase FadM
MKQPFVYTMRVRFRDTDMFYVNANCVYLGSARFEEDVHVETRISPLGTRKGDRNVPRFAPEPLARTGALIYRPS